jgi:hypothetical protein
MSLQPVTVNLPQSLYDRLRRRAEQSKRTLEAELVEAVASAVPPGDKLPDDLAEALNSLTLLDDEALWRAARGPLPSQAAEKLESLHLKRQSQGLTETEASELEGLVRQYERTMLVRAYAAKFLKERGHDISGLIPRT